MFMEIHIDFPVRKQSITLHRLTGLINLPSRKVIYSNFSFLPQIWITAYFIFTSRESFDMIEKIQEQTLRFVLRDQVSSTDVVLENTDYKSFRSIRRKIVTCWNVLYWIITRISVRYISEIKQSSLYDG